MNIFGTIKSWFSPKKGISEATVSPKHVVQRLEGETLQEHYQTVVDRINPLISSGVSYKDIATKLNQEGLKTVTGRQWTSQRLQGIIKRARRAGVFVSYHVKPGIQAITKHNPPGPTPLHKKSPSVQDIIDGHILFLHKQGKSYKQIRDCLNTWGYKNKHGSPISEPYVGSRLHAHKINTRTTTEQNPMREKPRVEYTPQIKNAMAVYGD